MTVTNFKTFDSAFQSISEICPPPKTECVEVNLSRGRVLTKDVVAKENVPPFARAVMDGFAISASDLQVSNEFHVLGMVKAGDDVPRQIGPQQAFRIMTGAPVPSGADAVARFEWCDIVDNSTVSVLKPIQSGESIQSLGDDGVVGQVVLKSGTRITGLHAGACSSFGVSEVHVSKPCVISVITTGSEVVHHLAVPLKYGQIYGANDKVIQFAVEEDGGVIHSVVHVPDDALQIRDAIVDASTHSDYVILTGGVSVGDYDCVPLVLRELGCDLVTEKVWMRPGSPFVSTMYNDCVVFALSGNPAACSIQFETLVRPHIRKSMGWHDVAFPCSGKLVHPVRRKPIKHEFIFRAKAHIEEGHIWVNTAFKQASGVMSSFAESNCLIRVSQSEMDAGAVVPLRWL